MLNFHIHTQIIQYYYLVSSYHIYIKQLDRYKCCRVGAAWSRALMAEVAAERFTLTFYSP